MAVERQSDFVMVRLTERGRELAAGGPMSFANGRRNFTFRGEEPQKVERSYEWNFWLRDHHTPDGRVLLELAPGADQVQTNEQVSTEENHDHEVHE